MIYISIKYKNKVVNCFVLMMNLLFSDLIFSQSVFVPLGVNGSVPISHAFGLSGNGNVIVGQSQAFPFRWTQNEGMINIGIVPNFQYGSAFSTNYDGTVVVGQATRGTNSSIGFLWKDGKFSEIGYQKNYSNSVYDVSSDGSVLVGYTENDTGKYAFVWGNGESKLLGNLLGGKDGSEASAVSSLGTKIVGGCKSDKGFEACVWTSSNEIIGLGVLLTENYFSYATDISADGSTIVGYSALERISASQSRIASFVWTESAGIKNLGFISEESKSSFATAISGNGDVIVGKEDEIGYIWIKGKGIRYLKKYLEYEYNIDLTGWTLIPQDISYDGKVIVGYGKNPNGKEEAWKVELTKDPTSISDQSTMQNVGFNLSQNYPNPFNPTTTIMYSIPKTSFVTIKIFDVLGREVALLENEEKSIGTYQVVFNAANLSSGIYFYTIKAGDYIQTRKLILLK